jgi:hypothetical protein
MSSPENRDLYQARMYISEYGAIERARHDATAFHHTARHADASSGLVSLTRYPSGGPVDFMLDLPMTLRPRGLHLYDHSRPHQSVHLPTEIEKVYLLKTTLGLAEHDQIAARFFSPNDTVTELLNAEMDRLFAALNQSVPVFSERAFRRFVACVRMTLHETPPDDSTRVLAREALFDRIREYIATHIDRPPSAPTNC